jgi:nucleoside phosphorylase
VEPEITHLKESSLLPSNEFGPLELIFFIGIAASRKKTDAPIGSVVISNQVYLASVGKYEKGEFHTRARVFPSAPHLVGLSRKVARDERWHERLKPPYGEILPDHDGYPKPFPPTALIAPIVSVESVSADPNSVLEQQITNSYQDATALEMEGYGTLYAAHSENVPSIVIRGISDIREGKDAELDKIHQPIAAAHGAAFGFELLDVWDRTDQLQRSVTRYRRSNRQSLRQSLPRRHKRKLVKLRWY